MKLYLVPFRFEIDKVKLDDEWLICAVSPVEATNTLNLIIKSNPYLKVMNKDRTFIIPTATAKLKIGKIKEAVV